MSEESNPYSESRSIRLRPHEQVRLRPKMYFGGTDERALHMLAFEVLNDSVEEAFQQRCDHIWLTLHPNDIITIRDNSEGLPVRQLQNGKRLLEHIMTRSGTRRIRGETEAAGGLPGVGLSAVNALAAECTVQVAREDFLWQQSYREGVAQTDVVQVRPLEKGESTGTSITFRPDFTILERNSFSYAMLAERARELAYLLPGLAITVCDERGQTALEEKFYFTHGLTDYVRDLNARREPLHAPLSGSAEWMLRSGAGGDHTIHIDVALQYTASSATTIIGYANTRQTSGGLHMEMLPFAVAWTLRSRPLAGSERPFSPDECAPGLTAVISVRHPQPTFEGTSDFRLLNHDLVSVVFDAVRSAFWNSERGEAVGSIVEKCLENRRAIRF
jgi:DNA gyrase subunit B